MARAGVKWTGLEEFKRDLEALPMALANEARPLVQLAAESAADKMRASYPHKTGRLAAGVQVNVATRGKQQDSPTRPSWRVVNVTPYARFFEWGTRYQPPGRVFIPIRNAYQRLLQEALLKMLEKFSLRVRGSFDDAA